MRDVKVKTNNSPPTQSPKAEEPINLDSTRGQMVMQYTFCEDKHVCFGEIVAGIVRSNPDNCRKIALLVTE